MVRIQYLFKKADLSILIPFHNLVLTRLILFEEARKFCFGSKTFAIYTDYNRIYEFNLLSVTYYLYFSTTDWSLYPIKHAKNDKKKTAVRKLNPQLYNKHHLRTSCWATPHLSRTNNKEPCKSGMRNAAVIGFKLDFLVIYKVLQLTTNN